MRVRLNVVFTQNEVVRILNSLPRGLRKEVAELALLVFFRSDAGRAYLSCKGVNSDLGPAREVGEVDQDIDKEGNNDQGELISQMVGDIDD